MASTVLNAGEQNGLFAEVMVPSDLRLMGPCVSSLIAIERVGVSYLLGSSSADQTARTEEGKQAGEYMAEPSFM